MENSKVLGKATFWSATTEVVAKIIGPIVNMVLARLLAPEAFGIVATITMITSFADIFTDAGFQKYIIQHEFKSKKDLDNTTNVAFWTNLVCSCFVVFFIFWFRNSLAIWVGSPNLGDSIVLASLNIIISSFSSIQMSRYKRDFDFKTLFYARMGNSLIPIVVTIPLAFILRNYWALLIGTFASNLFTAIFLSVKSEWKPKRYYNIVLFKEMFSFSAWTLLESVAIWLTSYIGVFIVGNYLNSYYLGLYKSTMTTINSYMAIITSSIMPVLFSALSRTQNNENDFKNTFYTFQRLTSVFVFPMGVGIYIYRELVTWILLGSQWMEASEFIGLWGLTSSITIVFSNFSSEVYRSKGNPKISLLVQIIHLVVLIPVLIVSVNYGFEILYISRSIVRFQIVITSIIFMQFIYGFKFKDICRNVLPAFVSTMIMGVTGSFARTFVSNPIVEFATIFLCIGVYFTVLFLIFPQIKKEVMGIDLVNKYLSKMGRFLKYKERK